MINGYVRVSTKEQEKGGNSLEDQEGDLMVAGCNEIYQDSFNGTKLIVWNLKTYFKSRIGKQKLVIDYCIFV